MGLTDDQKQTIEEIENIAALTGLDYRSSIADPARADWVTADLQDVLEMMVRGYIVTEYVVLDELMDIFMLKYFLGEDVDDLLAGAKDLDRLWNFTHHVLEGLSLLQKYGLFKKVNNPPSYVEGYVTSANTLRNAVAHTFVIEKRRVPVKYRKLDVFTFDGLRRFAEDGMKAKRYLHKEIQGSEFMPPRSR